LTEDKNGPERHVAPKGYRVDRGRDGCKKGSGKHTVESERLGGNPTGHAGPRVREKKTAKAPKKKRSATLGARWGRPRCCVGRRSTGGR